MDIEAQMRAWSYRRQLLNQPSGTLEQALRGVVAVYATHPTAPLSLRARTRSFTPARYRRLDRDRKGARLPAMRRSVFLVPMETASHIFNAVRASEAQAFGRLKRIGFSKADYETFAKKILKAAKEPLTTKGLERAAGIKGMELTVVLRSLRDEGLILTLAGDSLNSSPHRYVAASVWAPEMREYVDQSDALAWLANEYLRAYGPARIEDFVWWAGTGKRKGAAAMGSLDTVDIGDGYLLPRSDEAGFTRVKPVRNSVALLPRWDAYTMGHAPDGRRRFVHPDCQEAVYTPIGVGMAGDGNPVVLVDGEAVATWTYSAKEGGDVQPFDKLGPKVRKRVAEELDGVAALLSG